MNVIHEIECGKISAVISIPKNVKVFSIFSEIWSEALIDREKTVGRFYAVAFHFCVKSCRIYRKQLGCGGLISAGFHQGPLDHSRLDGGHLLFEIDRVVGLSRALLTQYFLERIDLSKKYESQRAQGFETGLGQHKIGDLGFLQDKI